MIIWLCFGAAAGNDDEDDTTRGAHREYVDEYPTPQGNLWSIHTFKLVTTEFFIKVMCSLIKISNFVINNAFFAYWTGLGNHIVSNNLIPSIKKWFDC